MRADLDDAQSLSQLSDAGMDAVICHMALMDIPDLEATLSSVRRVLVDHGRLVFTILHLIRSGFRLSEISPDTSTCPATAPW